MPPAANKLRRNRRGDALEAEHRREMREHEMEMNEVHDGDAHSTLMTIFMLPWPDPQKWSQIATNRPAVAGVIVTTDS